MGFPVGAGVPFFCWANAAEDVPARRTIVRMSALRNAIDANMVGNLLQNLSRIDWSSEESFVDDCLH
jgi:hypothetical protein